jgi:hypothetical protein
LIRPPIDSTWTGRVRILPAPARSKGDV